MRCLRPFFSPAERKLNAPFVISTVHFGMIQIFHQYNSLHRFSHFPFRFLSGSLPINVHCGSYINQVKGAALVLVGSLERLCNTEWNETRIRFINHTCAQWWHPRVALWFCFVGCSCPIWKQLHWGSTRALRPADFGDATIVLRPDKYKPVYR